MFFSSWPVLLGAWLLAIPTYGVSLLVCYLLRAVANVHFGQLLVMFIDDSIMGARTVDAPYYGKGAFRAALRQLGATDVEYEARPGMRWMAGEVTQKTHGDEDQAYYVQATWCSPVSMWVGNSPKVIHIDGNPLGGTVADMLAVAKRISGLHDEQGQARGRVKQEADA